MSAPSSRTGTQTLRMSTSHGNLRPSSSSAALGGSAPPRERKERRRPPPVSLSGQQSTSTSPSSYTGISSNLTPPGAQCSPPPPSLSSASARLEESYLAAKRRAHRHSYFDRYPDRGQQRRTESEKEDGYEAEAARGIEEGEKIPPLPTASVNVATHPRTQEDGNSEEEGDSFEVFGRTALRKSLSVGAGERVSNSLAALGISRKGKERNGCPNGGAFDRHRAQEEGVAFPVMRSTRGTQRSREDSSSAVSARAYAKGASATSSRTLTAPKVPTHPYGACRDDLPGLRFSYSTYSSSQTQGETPPQTPIEASTRGPIHVVVAAPISGVEAMDALVDGMDGSDDDDVFKRLQNRAKSSVHNHHPLYAPPLPEPPPGIVLGRGNTQRKASVSSGNEDDGDYEELQSRPSTHAGTERSSTKRRHENGRSASSSTILADMSERYRRPSTASPKMDREPAHAPPPSIDEIIRKHTVLSPHQTQSHTKSMSPFISDIIRRNTQPGNSSQPRPTTGVRSRTTSATGHNGRQGSSLSDSDPEPLTPSEEAALVARSSIDSVAAEVQQSLRAHKKILKPDLPATSSATTSSNTSLSQDDASTSRYSYYSYKTTRSAGGCDQSIRSGSASASASTSNGAGVASNSPGLSSDPEFTQSFRSQNGRSKRPQQNGQQKEAIATYLRSARMTTLLRLTRRPHASEDRPLTVSLSDLGSQTGFPLVVFLGLGCVRYVMGLYDEMAECLGLRLITIDRWGLGRTDVPHSSASRGVPEWSTVVDEVLDRLNIDRCGIMAHSAGAPYALSFASRYPERVIGDICLLAPWVGGGAGSGYRWLKYVPNGLLKTAQAAEWKIQAWMIGKPPKITYEGIGYNAEKRVSSATYNIDSSGHFVRARSKTDSHEEDSGDDETADFSSHVVKRTQSRTSAKSSPYSTGLPPKSRPSDSSGNTFSDYDDLADFCGRFDSQTTFERRRSRVASADGHTSPQDSGIGAKKRNSRGFLRIWKGLPNNNPGPVPPLPAIETSFSQQRQPTSTQSQPPTPQPKRKLKSLKSISSIRSRTSTTTVPTRPKTAETSPVLPEQSFETSLHLEMGEFGLGNTSDKEASASASQSTRPRLGLDTKNQSKHAFPYSAVTTTTTTSKSRFTSHTPATNGPPNGTRAGGRRSISFTTTTSTSYSLMSRPSLPHASQTYFAKSSPANASPSKKEGGESYQVAMGNALIAASHSESSRGTHPDLLQILNHEQRPWGFSYSRYPHRVRVWYGDKDERIAAESVKWMESAMGSERCRVTVVKGADHGLMYRTNVVVDVLEEVQGAWIEVVHGSRRREMSVQSDPMVTSGLEIGSDPFKSL